MKRRTTSVQTFCPHEWFETCSCEPTDSELDQVGSLMELWAVLTTALLCSCLLLL